MSKRLASLQTIVRNANRLLNSSTLRDLFQTPQKSSIQKITDRFTDTYVDLLEWTQSTRDADVPDPWKPVYEALGEYPDLIVQRFREFVDEIRRQAEDIAAARSAGKSHGPLKVTLDFEIGDTAVDKMDIAMRLLSSTKPTPPPAQCPNS